MQWLVFLTLLGYCSFSALCQAPTAPTCRDGWSLLQNVCYFHSGSKHVHAYEILHECYSMHPAAFPVSIHHVEVQHFLRLLANGSTTWIGLVRDQWSGRWHWYDDSAVDYVNWESGKPTDDFNCVYVDPSDYGQWVSYPCDSALLPFFCQLPLEPVF